MRKSTRRLYQFILPLLLSSVIFMTPEVLQAETLDQVNDPAWSGGAVNVIPSNKVSQTFVPSLPVLTTVEVALKTGNKGRGGDQLTLMILNTDGQQLASSTAFVNEGFDGFLRLTLQGSGISVTPGRTLTIRLQDTGKNVFWWKYKNGNTYRNGQAIFHGSPFSDNDFFFKTYGTTCGQNKFWCARQNVCAPICDISKCQALSSDGLRCISLCSTGWYCGGGKCCRDMGNNLTQCQNFSIMDPCR